MHAYRLEWNQKGEINKRRLSKWERERERERERRGGDKSKMTIGAIQ